jgi:F-type H+-transporting ATPase subunit b
VLTAVVTQTGGSFSVRLIQTVPPTEPVEEAETSEEETESHDDVTLTTEGVVAKDDTAHVAESEAAPGPNPIVPEIKEVVWGAGAFIVFALIIRYVAFPKLKKGMDARYAGIRSAHESADATRLGAQAEVAEYQAQLATVKAEAAARIDAARQQLETERSARIGEVNARIADRRTAALAEAEAARAAVQDQVSAAVSDVATVAVRHAIGREPDAAVIDRVVSGLSTGATR